MTLSKSKTPKRRQRRPWQTKDDDFLLEHYSTRGGKWCADQLSRGLTHIYKKAGGLSLSPPLPISGNNLIYRVSTAQHGTLYTAEQIKALDAIGIAWTRKQIDWKTACNLRELVKAKRCGEAMVSLELSERRAA